MSPIKYPETQVEVEVIHADFGQTNHVDVELKISGYLEDDEGNRHFVNQEKWEITIPIVEVD